MNILVTAGATREKIDAIRFITNISTGETGLFIASYFSENGHSVTLLKPKSVMVSDTQYKTDSFVSVNDLKNKLHFYLQNYNFDAVIHLAAVGDFNVNYISQNNKKIKPPDKKLKTSDTLTIELKANPKLLSELKSLSKNPNILVVGFKLSYKTQEKPKLDQKVDIWVSNKYEDVDGFLHKAEIYTNTSGVFTDSTKKVNNKKELSCALLDMIQKLL